jgi:hypothetical protein
MKKIVRLSENRQNVIFAKQTSYNISDDSDDLTILLLFFENKGIENIVE